MTPLALGLVELSLEATASLCRGHENNKAITALGKVAELAATGVGVLSGHALASIGFKVGKEIVSSAQNAWHDHQTTAKAQESCQQQKSSLSLHS